MPSRRPRQTEMWVSKQEYVGFGPEARLKSHFALQSSESLCPEAMASWWCSSAERYTQGLFVRRLHVELTTVSHFAIVDTF